MTKHIVTGKFGIGKNKSGVQYDDKQGGHSKPDVPAKVHAADDVAYAKPPQGEGAEGALQFIFHFVASCFHESEGIGKIMTNAS
jgi:hypothetical protein